MTLPAGNWILALGGLALVSLVPIVWAIVDVLRRPTWQFPTSRKVLWVITLAVGWLLLWPMALRLSRALSDGVPQTVPRRCRQTLHGHLGPIRPDRRWSAAIASPRRVVSRPVRTARRTLVGRPGMERTRASCAIGG